MRLTDYFPRSPGKWAVIHAAAVNVILSWCLGGMSATTRLVAELGTLPALPLAFWAWYQASSGARQAARRIALPLALLALLLGVGSLNPGATPVHFGETLMLRPDSPVPWLPSCFYPATAWRDFALNAGFILMGINLLLTSPRRSWLRGLLTVVTLNAAVLACVGSFFKLQGATAILHLIPSPNPHFFASFIYHNHWGAFALLAAGAAAGLAFYYEHQRHGRPLTATPCLSFALAALLIALTLPLSTSRSATAVGALLIGSWLVLTLRRAWRKTGQNGLIAVLLLAMVFGTAGGWLVSRDFQHAVQKTHTQIDTWSQSGGGEGRPQIYRDTLKLIAAKPVFGWGWHSFPYTFPLVQTPLPKLQNEQRLPTAVVDAHNDWLQFLAENGIVGMALALTMLAGIFRAASASAWWQAPTREIILAIAGVALMALVDFPLACPAVALTAGTLLFTAATLARGIASPEPQAKTTLS